MVAHRVLKGKPPQLEYRMADDGQSTFKEVTLDTLKNEPEEFTFPYFKLNA